MSPKRLVEPGPAAVQLLELLEMAAAAPDHGQLRPWRFVIVPVDKRERLAEAFALALVDRDPIATLEQVEAAREKAYRAPLLMLAVVQTGSDAPEVPALERTVSLGAAIQNLLLAAHSLGFGGGLTSGKAMGSACMRTLCADRRRTGCLLRQPWNDQHDEAASAPACAVGFCSTL